MCRLLSLLVFAMAFSAYKLTQALDNPDKLELNMKLISQVTDLDENDKHIRASTEKAQPISVWAKKAGGGNRRRNTFAPKFPMSEDKTGLSESESGILSREVQDKNLIGESTANANLTIASFEDSDEEEEDPECPEGQFWHIRSRNCVPLNCPGGNKQRDRTTGKCLWGSNYYRRMYSSRRSFSRHRSIRPMKGNRQKGTYHQTFYVQNQPIATPSPKDD